MVLYGLQLPSRATDFGTVQVENVETRSPVQLCGKRQVNVGRKACRRLGNFVGGPAMAASSAVQ